MAGVLTVVFAFHRTEADVFIALVVGAFVLERLDGPFGYSIEKLVQAQAVDCLVQY
jgi:putative Ca2+/H+ antiporter (TMEM165/GDT1 family)